MLVKGKELFKVILPQLRPALLEGQRAPDKVLTWLGLGSRSHEF